MWQVPGSPLCCNSAGDRLQASQLHPTATAILSNLSPRLLNPPFPPLATLCYNLLGQGAILFQALRHKEGWNLTVASHRHSNAKAPTPASLKLYTFLYSIFLNYYIHLNYFPIDRGCLLLFKNIINHETISFISRSTVPISERTQKSIGTKDSSKKLWIDYAVQTKHTNLTRIT